jgi:hypothetical protein
MDIDGLQTLEPQSTVGVVILPQNHGMLNFQIFLGEE